MVERVVPLTLDVRWCPAAPYAVLLADADGETALALAPHFDDPDQRAVVLRWMRTSAATMSGPNDEALSGHRLWSSGLNDVLWMGEVLDSSWIAAQERTNSVHDRHDPARFAALRHFVVLLKECVVEVTAETISVDRVAARTTREAAGVR
jgi:hypothetical protein